MYIQKSFVREGMHVLDSLVGGIHALKSLVRKEMHVLEICVFDRCWWDHEVAVSFLPL